MDTDIKIGVIGGDLRQIVCAGELASEGFEVAIYGFEDYNGPVGGVTRCVGMEDALRSAAAVVLPLPYSFDRIHLNTPLTQSDIHLDHLFKCMERGQAVMGGRLDKVAEGYAEAAGVRLHDYYQREELSVLNAIPTAEGAVSIVMQEINRTLTGSRALVLGYGRIGKILAHRLSALSVGVEVAARSGTDFAWIKAYGYGGVKYDELAGRLETYHIIVNTVPSLVLDAQRLSRVRHDAVIVDLASKPGGVDINAAKELGLNVIWALSLPGKFAPVTSGATLKEGVMSIMREEGLI